MNEALAPSCVARYGQSLVQSAFTYVSIPMVLPTASVPYSRSDLLQHAMVNIPGENRHLRGGPVAAWICEWSGNCNLQP